MGLVKGLQTRAGRFSLVAFSVWAIYCALLLLLIPRHEPWFDEAQAWLLARDARYPELLTHYLRYEGSPGLWHSILLLPAKVGAPYRSMNFISGAFAALGAAVLVFRSPFPAIIKYTLPFTFFLLYQYAVVARSYTLVPPLLFLIAVLYSRAEQHICAFALLLALLANVSLHGFVLSGTIMLNYTWQCIARWSKWSAHTKRHHIILMVALLLIGLLLILELYPPSDITGFSSLNYSPKHLIAVSALKISDALTGSLWTSIPLFTVSCWWFWRTHLLIMFLSGVAALSIIAGVIYSHVWHEGLVFVFWVFALWLSYDRTKREGTRVPSIVPAAILLVTAVQIYWSACTIRFDYNNAYSGSRELAEYLVRNHLDRSGLFSFGFKSISVLAYFPRNIFENYHGGTPPSFWLWSKSNDLDCHLDQIAQKHPRAVILSIIRDDDLTSNHLRDTLAADGYRKVRRFDGALYWKTKVLEGDSFELWEPI